MWQHFPLKVFLSFYFLTWNLLIKALKFRYALGSNPNCRFISLRFYGLKYLLLSCYPSDSMHGIYFEWKKFAKSPTFISPVRYLVLLFVDIFTFLSFLLTYVLSFFLFFFLTYLITDALKLLSFFLIINLLNVLLYRPLYACSFF